MRKQISYITPHQTATVLALLYFALGIIAAVLMLFGLFAPSEMPIGLLFVIIMPIVYAVVGYISTIIVCFFYNLAASLVGGIELTLTDTSAK